MTRAAIAKGELAWITWAPGNVLSTAGGIGDLVKLVEGITYVIVVVSRAMSRGRVHRDRMWE